MCRAQPPSDRTSIDWGAVHAQWNKSQNAPNINTRKLKSKWQVMQRPASRVDTPASASTDDLMPSFSSSSSTFPSSSVIVPVPVRPVQPSGNPPPREPLHPLDSGNYTLKALGDVVLSLAPSGTRYSAEELQIFEYILERKLFWKPTQGVSWKTFESHWKSVSRVAKLRNKCAQIFLRSAAQLEEKWHSSEKAKFSEAATKLI